jgi:hypothetical protein
MTPRQSLIILFFVLLGLYALFQARFLIIGPYIRIEEPKNGALLDTELVVVKGVSKNAAWLSMNGRQIFTDEKGHFSERLVLSEGTSIITFEARDRFGRVRDKSVQVIYKPSEKLNETEEKEGATSTESGI